MTNIAPSIFNAYNICPRQAWLMSRNLSADQQNSYIEIGKLIDENSFSRDNKGIYLADIGAMIDMITKKDGTYIIAEVKKSSKMLESSIWQLKYYLYLLKNKKKINIKGLIKVPREKISKEVELTDEDEEKIDSILLQLTKSIEADHPVVLKKQLRFCKKCAHYEFCWS